MAQSSNTKRWLGALRTVGLPLGAGFVVSQVLSGVWGPASPACFGVLAIGTVLLVPAFLPRRTIRAKRIKAAKLSAGRKANATLSAQVMHRASISLAVVLGIIIVSSGLVRINREVALARDGRVARAQIINNEPGSAVPLAGGNLLYSFGYNGVAYTGWAHVNRLQYQRLRLGAYVPVTFLAADPGASHFGRISPAQTAWQIANTTLLTLLSAFLAGYIALGYERHYRRELNLALRGTEVIGTITHCRAIHRHGKPFGYRVQYRIGLDSSVSEGTATVLPVCGEPTLVGFPVAVLVDANQPDYHRPVSALSSVQVTSPTLLSNSAHPPLTPNLLE